MASSPDTIIYIETERLPSTDFYQPISSAEKLKIRVHLQSEYGKLNRIPSVMIQCLLIKKIDTVLKFLTGQDSEVDNFFRLGKPKKNGIAENAPRVVLRNAWQVHLILSSKSKVKDYQRPIFSSFLLKNSK